MADGSVLAGVQAILTDVEGTTTPVSFVYDTLFPYARERLAETCRRAGDDPRIAEAVRLLLAEYGEESRDDTQGRPPTFDASSYARFLMDADRKSTGLKALQGVIWEDGYRTGTLRASVFDDVPSALESWRRDGIRLRVFSSGSVLAQKLLFAHTGHGDLTPHFEGYHDTTTGPKREARAYAAIARAFELPAAAVLYLSDVRAELDPAAEAGMRTGMLVRPGNRPEASGQHTVYPDFAALAH